MMNRAVRIGLLGGGMWGRVHLDGLRELGSDRARIHWICTRTQENLEELRQRYGVPHATTNARRMLADPELDAVIVATPPFLHAEHGVAVLESGKHLLLEKPLAATAEDADRLVAAATGHPDLISLDASCRFSRLNPKYEFIRSIIASGTLGTVYHIHHHEMKPSTYVDHNPRAAEWAADPERAGGGPVIDWGPYDFAFHFGLLDDLTPPRRVSAIARMEGGIERHAVAIIEFGGGLTYQFERMSGGAFRSPSTTRIHGTSGTLVFGYQPWEPQTVELYRRESDGGLSHETLHCHYERTWHENTYLLEHFVDCIDGAAVPLMPFELARRNLDVSLGVLAELRSR